MQKGEENIIILQKTQSENNRPNVGHRQLAVPLGGSLMGALEELDQAVDTRMLCSTLLSEKKVPLAFLLAVQQHQRVFLRRNWIWIW